MLREGLDLERNPPAQPEADEDQGRGRVTCLGGNGPSQPCRQPGDNQPENGTTAVMTRPVGASRLALQLRGAANCLLHLAAQTPFKGWRMQFHPGTSRS